MLLHAIVGVSRGAYQIRALERVSAGLCRSLAALATAAVLVLMVAFFVQSSENISRLNFGLGLVFATVLMGAFRVIWARHFARTLMQGSLLDQLVILDGKRFGTPLSEDVVVIDAGQIGLRPDLSEPAMLSYFGDLISRFDRVLIHSTEENRHAWSMMLKGANVDGEILVEEINLLGAIGVKSFEGRDTLLVSRQPLDLPSRMKKRLLDLAITLPLIVFLAPLLILVAIGVKLDSRGSIFFLQDRVGRGNRMFKVIKFRTMRAETCDADGNRSTLRDDDRVTRIGRILRATSIDELPQLFNVLLGDMSLVGPRPHALGSLAGGRLFWQVDEAYWLRHQLKPGITGLAQVRGFRGTTFEPRDLVHRLQSDMEYIQGWDIWRDVVILWNTFRVLVHRNAF